MADISVSFIYDMNNCAAGRQLKATHGQRLRNHKWLGSRRQPYNCIAGLGFLSTWLSLYQVRLQLPKAPPTPPQFGSFYVTLRPWERSCEWRNERPSACCALHILVYLQVTLVPINQLKPTFVYATWLRHLEESTGSLGVTGIMLLGVLYKNMAQVYPGFPYPSTTGASNVDLFPLWHLQCQGVPAKHTHTLQHITQLIQVVFKHQTLIFLLH